ncbi:hypothetical protein TWF225_008833 [Orbilia oligospora]|nr:hypothetical protein TWF225_008833 [Orbilia oligospora]KAF3231436.1 hypothetical protein TWF128_004795 [Orbilia oligospora]KAF3254636.1 hypothetical protein TWF217_006851 [Orbilia oligospora]KAF3282520.1 hypothetical protein TWF132_010652 [Orbilia oligospora]
MSGKSVSQAKRPILRYSHTYAPYSAACLTRPSPSSDQAQSQTSIEGDILIQLSYSAAKTFVTNYYTDLQAARTKLKEYYAPTPSISWNGNDLSGGAADVEKLHTEMPAATYEVQCFDAQPLTPNGKGQCSILLTTNGYVKFGNEKDAPSRGFSETITLEPDDSTPVKFLISTQCTRFVF